MSNAVKTILYSLLITVLLIILGIVIIMFGRYYDVSGIYLPTLIVLGSLLIILLLIVEWSIGELIGGRVNSNTGVILGVIFIFLGISFLMGIATIVYSQKNKSKIAIDINSDMNVKLKREGQAINNEINQHQNKFYGKNWKDILVENDLSEYCDIFETNKLTNIDIIQMLTDDDLEKIGIQALGDRKKILRAFAP
jgi:ABC-type transport system involved in multi-copper enzyme maturation permease subunit